MICILKFVNKHIWKLIGNLFNNISIITIKDFREKGIIKNKEMIKILGDGNIKDSIKLEVNAISQSARKKIEKAGGEIIIKES